VGFMLVLERDVGVSNENVQRKQEECFLAREY
jgi:hypothetical protein